MVQMMTQRVQEAIVTHGTVRSCHSIIFELCEPYSSHDTVRHSRPDLKVVTAVKQCSSFLELPAEIRDRIYSNGASNVFIHIQYGGILYPVQHQNFPCTASTGVKKLRQSQFAQPNLRMATASVRLTPSWVF